MREDTITDYDERMNRVLAYIQQNLDQSLSLETIAAQACFSPFHFHRIFSAYVNETLNGYVRRLRLESAAARLCHSHGSITEIALSAGYETPGAFSKAFKQHFGMNPSGFRKQRSVYERPAMGNLKPVKREEQIMDVEIRELEEMEVLYVRKTGAYEKAACAAWRTLCFFAGPRRLLTPQTIFIGIGLDDPKVTPAEKLRYDACISIDRPAKPRGKVGQQTITGGRYAVFLHKGPYTDLSQAYDKAYGKWLPESGEELREVPCFELHLNDVRKTPPEELLTEIHVPIK